jgi:DNA-binding response OmpR family regulator
MQNHIKILYVEDDIGLSFVTKDNLELKGYDIFHFEDGQKAFERFNEEHFDLCILDVMLPGMDGFSLAAKIRAKNKDVPIIFLTARSMLEDKIKGLTLGGDDYLTKPFSIEELVLKIEIFLKRNQVGASNAVGEISIGQYTLDYNNLTLLKGKRKVELTQKEADLLKFLSVNKSKVLKREDILTAVWGDDSYFLSRSLDVFISRLRKYLREDKSIRIRNVHGVGFCLVVKHPSKLYFSAI